MVIERKYTDQLVLEKLDRIVELLESIALKSVQPSATPLPKAEPRIEAPPPPPVYIGEKEAVKLTGMSAAWFQRARWAGNGPPFIKMGGKRGKVQYNREELLKWFEAHKVGSTSEY